MDMRSASGLEAVEAHVRYALPTPTKPFCYEYDPPPGKPKRSANYRAYRVVIRNGRTRTPPLGLATDGFALERHASDVRDFYDDSEIRAVYYPEVEQLVKHLTGASHALVFDHNVRGNTEGKLSGTAVHAPVLRAHNDFTIDSAPRRARALLGAQAADQLLRQRFMEINVWRPIRGPLKSMPLAVCSAASMQAADFLACDLIYPDRLGEIYEITHSPEHEWYYFPDMQRDEVLLLKCFDSHPDPAGFGAHSAFEHPHTPPDALPRESIETRVFAFFRAAGSG